MKKILFLVMIFFTLSMFSGCDIYADKSKRQMELIDVKVFDEENNEIIGTFKNYYTEIRRDGKLNLNGSFLPLNAARPVINYYFVQVKNNCPYTVKFTFYSKLGYKLSKVDFSNENESSSIAFECSNIEKIDKNYIATLNINEVNDNNKLLHIVNWYKGEEKHRFSTMGSNTYIKGVYFSFESLENTCLIF